MEEREKEQAGGFKGRVWGAAKDAEMGEWGEWKVMPDLVFTTKKLVQGRFRKEPEV